MIPRTRDGKPIKKRMTVYSIYGPHIPLKVIEYCEMLEYLKVEKEGRSYPICADASFFCKDQIEAVKENMPMVESRIAHFEKEIKENKEELKELKRLLKIAKKTK